MTLDKRIGKSSPTPIGDKIPEKETKKQLIESSRHHSDKKNNVTPTEKTKKKTVAKVGDSIVRNVTSRSFNQSLKEYFRIVKPFLGPTTQDMNDYIKPAIARNQDMVILHTGTNDLKSKQNPLDIANEIINLAKISGTEYLVEIDYLRMVKKVKLNSKLNSKLDLFSISYILIKKAKVFLKENLENLLMNMSHVFHKGIMSLFKITIFR